MCPFGARLWPTLCKQVDVRRVIVLEEEGARGARHALHGGGTHDAVLLVAAEREWHSGPTTHQDVALQLLTRGRDGRVTGDGTAIEGGGVEGWVECWWRGG